MSATTHSRKPIDPETWYSAVEAAEILCTKHRTIQRERLHGRLKGAAINGRGDLRFLGRWLLDWLESQTAKRRTRKPAHPDPHTDTSHGDNAHGDVAHGDSL